MPYQNDSYFKLFDCYYFPKPEHYQKPTKEKIEEAQKLGESYELSWK